MRVKDLSKYSKPREKLQRYGVTKLADHELLAIILGSGIQGTNVVELSKKIVKTIQDIGSEALTLKDLLLIRGLGEVKAMQIMAALEYGSRQQDAKADVVMSPEKVFELCADIRNSKKEHFVAFYLNSRGALMEREIISIGTLDASLVHPREVFEPALRHCAASIIVAHNHPSNDTKHSHEDVEVTKQLVHAGKLLGIEVVDHVVVSKDKWTSIL